MAFFEYNMGKISRTSLMVGLAPLSIIGLYFLINRAYVEDQSPSLALFALAGL